MNLQKVGQCVGKTPLIGQSQQYISAVAFRWQWLHFHISMLLPTWVLVQITRCLFMECFHLTFFSRARAGANRVFIVSD